MLPYTVDKIYLFSSFSTLKYYAELKFVLLGFKRLVTLQSVNKVKLNL